MVYLFCPHMCMIFSAMIDPRALAIRNAGIVM